MSGIPENRADFEETVLITGASSGIGYDLAQIFSAKGHRLILVARSREKLAKLAGELEERHGVSVKVIPMDLSHPSSPGRLYEILEEESFQVSILVNNAGFAAYGLFSDSSLDGELEMMRLNMITPVHLTKLILKGMRERGRGRILNVASTAAFQPGPLMAVYYATKAFLLFFSEALAHELRGSGVCVTALCPGPTRTGFQKRAGMRDTLLFKYAVMNSREVALAGYEGLMKGKTLVVPGLANRILSFSVRFGPRGLTAKIVRFLQS